VRHSINGRQGVGTKTSTALVDGANGDSGSSIQPGMLSRTELSLKRVDSTIQSSPTEPTSDKGQRTGGKRTTGDTVNTIASSDTRTDMQKRSRRAADSEPAAAVRQSTWQREQLRVLAVVSLVAAVISGVALGVVFSRPLSAPEGRSS